MLELYMPLLADLKFRQELMNDANTMSYNHAYGGTICFSESKWEYWYNYWIVNCENKRFYRYLFNKEQNEFVGEVAYHYDESRNIFICDIVVLADHRNKGYGEIGLTLLCNSAKANGVKILYDDIATDNPSVSLFIKNGFSIDYQNENVTMVKKVL